MYLVAKSIGKLFEKCRTPEASTAFDRLIEKRQIVRLVCILDPLAIGCLTRIRSWTEGQIAGVERDDRVMLPECVATIT